MKAPWPVEEFRFASGGSVVAGILDLPLGVPPFPVAFLVSSDPARDIFGAPAGIPNFWLYLELARLLTGRGMALARVDTPSEEGDPDDHWRDAWHVVARHPLASRARMGLVALDTGHKHMGALKELPMDVAPPKGVLLVRPRGRVSPPPWEGVHVGLIDGEGQEGLQALSGLRPEVRVVADLGPDLRRSEDAASERPIPHPELLLAIADLLPSLLPAPSEDSARRPGVGLG